MSRFDNPPYYISAYSLAVKRGFCGTEAQWLESLKGARGEKGDKGETGEKGEKGDPGEILATELTREKLNEIIREGTGSTKDAFSVSSFVIYEKAYHGAEGDAVEQEGCFVYRLYLGEENERLFGKTLKIKTYAYGNMACGFEGKAGTLINPDANVEENPLSGVCEVEVTLPEYDPETSSQFFHISYGVNPYTSLEIYEKKGTLWDEIKKLQGVEGYEKYESAISAIRYVSQALTSKQQETARKNIGAAGNNELQGKSDVIQCKTGSFITLSNSANTPFKGLKLYGKTTQDGEPTPEAPVELVSAGTSGLVNVLIPRKNLFGGKPFADKVAEVAGKTVTDPEYITYKGSQIGGKILFEKFKPNTQYTFFLYGQQTNRYVQMKIKYTDGTLAPSGAGLRFPDTTEGLCLFTSNEGKSVECLVFSSQGSGISTKLYYDKCGIFEGVLTEDEFEPYAELDYVAVSTPGGLRGIPVADNGNFTDENGQHWICDQVDLDLGTRVQRIGVIDSFSGEEITDVYLSSTGELSEGATVQYVLAEPIETPITDAERAAYSALRTHEGSTTVYNSADVYMEAWYYTPSTPVQMVHSPADVGRIPSVDEHGCIVLVPRDSIKGEAKKEIGVVTPQMFGAVGDGMTDDTSAIQACFDYAYQNKFNVVFCKGTYIAYGLTLKPGVSVDGNGAILKKPNLSAEPYNMTVEAMKWIRLLSISHSGDTDSELTVIRNLELDGNCWEMWAKEDGYTQEQASLLIAHASNDTPGRLRILIENCYFHDSPSDGIHIINNVEATIKNCKSFECFRGGLTVTGGNTDVNVDGFESNSNILNDGIDVEVDSSGYDGSLTLNLNLSNILIDRDLDLGINAYSRCVVDNLVMRKGGYLSVCRGDLTIRNSYLLCDYANPLDPNLGDRFFVGHTANISFENVVFDGQNAESTENSACRLVANNVEKVTMSFNSCRFINALWGISGTQTRADFTVLVTNCVFETHNGFGGQFGELAMIFPTTKLIGNIFDVEGVAIRCFAYGDIKSTLEISNNTIKKSCVYGLSLHSPTLIMRDEIWTNGLAVSMEIGGGKENFYGKRLNIVTSDPNGTPGLGSTHFEDYATDGINTWKNTSGSVWELVTT